MYSTTRMFLWPLAAVLFGLIAAPALGATSAGSAEVIFDGAPPPPQSTIDDLARYMGAKSVTNSRWSETGELFLNVEGDKGFQLHRTRSEGGPIEQLTAEPYSVSLVGEAVNGDLLFTRATGGDENYQIFRKARGAAAVRLTDGKGRHENVLLSRAHDRFAFASNRRTGEDFDIYVTDMEGVSNAAPLVAKGGIWLPIAWSRDGDRLLVGSYRSETDVDAFLLDVRSAELTPLRIFGDRKANIRPLGFDRKGRVYFTSDEDEGVYRLGLYDIAQARLQWLSPKQRWEVDFARLSPDGSRVAYTVNEDGYTKVYALDTDTLAPVALPETPKGAIFGMAWSHDATRLALTINTPVRPFSLFVVDPAAGSVAAWPVAGSDREQPPTTDYELIHYPTFDRVDGRRRMISAWYVKPKGEGPHPVIVSLHGGPDGQAFAEYDAAVQYWVNRLGAAVLIPNVRGSTGYGRDFLAADNGAKRLDAVKDVGALLDWIDARPELDSGRVAVQGPSYGGYLALATMTTYPDRLRAGVDWYGIADFIGYFEATAPYRRDERRTEYGDERIPEMRKFLEQISPIRSIGRVRMPVFVAQGLNDPRVPPQQSHDVVAGLRKNGAPVWYLKATDEGHGFNKRSVILAVGAAQIEFFRRYLLPKTLPAK